jgi:hypothetical protein
MTTARWLRHFTLCVLDSIRTGNLNLRDSASRASWFVRVTS